ncbi:MAG: class I SAM-dependent methyltransferase [Actinomycetota bacterium]
MKSRRALGRSTHHPFHLPWLGAGDLTDNELSADDVVRKTGWVFNNETGDDLTLKEFVETGDKEVRLFMRLLRLEEFPTETSSLVEIGSGIGRMTAAFTQRFRKVTACDVDSAFLERCRQTVAKFGRIDRLITSHVADGKSLSITDNSADMAFSYITLQHCETRDALSLVGEAIRVTKPGGVVVLNFRTWVKGDVLLVPLGFLVRSMWRMPVVGGSLSRWRWSTRLGWQANRLKPDIVLAEFGNKLGKIQIFHSAKRGLTVTAKSEFDLLPTNRINPSHWWLVAQVS